jgi:hypothetical protein
MCRNVYQQRHKPQEYPAMDISLALYFLRNTKLYGVSFLRDGSHKIFILMLIRERILKKVTPVASIDEKMDSPSINSLLSLQPEWYSQTLLVPEAGVLPW